MRRGWFYRHAGHVHGPVTIRDLRAAVLLRFVSPDDLVRERVLGDWMPAREVPELHEVARPQPGEESEAAPKGFAVVELLGVIAIIAVLIVVLFAIPCRGKMMADSSNSKHNSVSGDNSSATPRDFHPERFVRGLPQPLKPAAEAWIKAPLDHGESREDNQRILFVAPLGVRCLMQAVAWTRPHRFDRGRSNV